MASRDAILATSLVVASPTEAGSPTSRRIAARMPWATAMGPEWSSRRPAMSMNASSTDTGSTSGRERLDHVEHPFGQRWYSP